MAQDIPSVRNMVIVSLAIPRAGHARCAPDGARCYPPGANSRGWLVCGVFSGALNCLTRRLKVFASASDRIAGSGSHCENQGERSESRLHRNLHVPSALMPIFA
jgi:hypothetical protein